MTRATYILNDNSDRCSLCSRAKITRLTALAVTETNVGFMRLQYCLMQLTDQFGAFNWSRTQRRGVNIQDTGRYSFHGRKPNAYSGFQPRCMNRVTEVHKERGVERGYLSPTGSRTWKGIISLPRIFLNFIIENVALVCIFMHCCAKIKQTSLIIVITMH